MSDLFTSFSPSFLFFFKFVGFVSSDVWWFKFTPSACFHCHLNPDGPARQFGIWRCGYSRFSYTRDSLLYNSCRKFPIASWDSWTTDHRAMRACVQCVHRVWVSGSSVGAHPLRPRTGGPEFEPLHGQPLAAQSAPGACFWIWQQRSNGDKWFARGGGATLVGARSDPPSGEGDEWWPPGTSLPCGEGRGFPRIPFGHTEGPNQSQVQTWFEFNPTHVWM